jgi:hypothetical protein
MTSIGNWQLAIGNDFNRQLAIGNEFNRQSRLSAVRLFPQYFAADNQ